MKTTQEYLILSVTLKSGRVVNLRKYGVRFRPIDTHCAAVYPAISGGTITLRNIRYQITAACGRFRKTMLFKHHVDCDLSLSTDRRRNWLRSHCGPLFERVPLNTILDSRKFGRTMGVQFVA